MATSEARRHDLYNRLRELLGEEPAGTLMAHLPTFDPTEIATKSDLAALSADIQTDMQVLRSEFAALKADVAALGARMDERFHRLTLTLVGGLFVIVAAMAGVVVASLV